MSKPTAIPISRNAGSRSNSPLPRDRFTERAPVSPIGNRADREGARDAGSRDREPSKDKDTTRDKDAKDVKRVAATAAIPAIATPPRELAARPTPGSPQLSPQVGERKTTRSESSGAALNRPQSPPQLGAALAKEAASIINKRAEGAGDDSGRRRSRDEGAARRDEEKKEEKKEKADEKKEKKKDKEHKEKKEKDKTKVAQSASTTMIASDERPEPPLPERKHSEPVRPHPGLLSPESRRVRDEEKTRSNSNATKDLALKISLPSDTTRRNTDRSPTSNPGTLTGSLVVTGDRKLPTIALPKVDPPPPTTSPKASSTSATSPASVPLSAVPSSLTVQSAPQSRRKTTVTMGSIDMRSAVAEPMGSVPVNVGTMTPRGITSIPASSLPTLELVPSTPKLFPWLLWVSDPADTTPTSGTATDFLFKSLMGEFLAVCSKKIADNMSLSLDVQFLLSDVFDFKNDPTFCALLAGLHELSKKHLSLVVRTLMTWKTRQITEVEKLKVRLQKDAKTGMSLKEGLVLLEERHQLCVDYTFLSTLQSLFKTALEDSVVDQLGDWVFDNLRPTDKKTDPQQSKALLTNRKSIPDLWSTVLGDLTRERMHVMATKFFKEIVYNNDKARGKATAVLVGAREVRLKLRSKASLQRSVAFLERYEQVMAEAKKKKDDIVTCLTETLTSILANSCNTPQKEGIDYTAWNTLITKMYSTYLERAKKGSKNALLFHPLCTMLLCVADTPFFNANWWTFLESVVLGPKYLKEKIFRGVHFECVRPLIENYFTRQSDPPEALSRLQFISATMYPPTSRKLLTPGTTEALSTFVDLIVAIAAAKLDFAVASIITELIRGPEMAPEKLFVGLRAFLRINSPPRPPDSPADALVLEKSRKYHRPQLNPDKAAMHFSKIATHLQQALLSLDPLFGWLQINQQKTLNELMAKEKVHPPQLCLDTIRIAIACIPIAMTQALPPELLTLLCRYLVHLDKPIQEAAYKTLYTLMSQRPDQRAQIAAALADFAFSIADKQNELIYIVLHKLALLLKEWELCVTKEEVKEPAKALPLNIVIKLEAVSLVFLCAPFSNIRLNALDCLSSTAAIVSRFSEDADLPAQRVHDIITEASPDVVQRLHQDYLFRLKNPIINPVENSMDKIVSSETSGGQLCWSFCFADLLKQIITLCPEPVRQAWSLVLSRIPAVQPTESDSIRFGAQTDTIEEEVGLAYWSNYILFACAAAQQWEEPRKPSAPSNLGPSETLRALAAKQHPPAPLDVAPTMTARQLLEQVSAALKTEHNDAVVMALSRTHFGMYETLFQVLQPLEKEYQTKKGTKRDRLRIDVSSVYAYVSESMKPGTLCSNDALRKLFIAHISDTMAFFARPENETIGDSNQFLRYNFCVTVKSVAQDLRGQEDRITKALRKQAFTFLLRWTTGESLLQEEGTKRIAQAMLSQIRDAEAKQDYERKLKESVLVLQFSAASAIGSLLLGPSWDDTANKPDGPVFSWVDRMLEQHQQKNAFFSTLSLASSAVESFLSANPQRDLLLGAVINRCYSSSVMIAKGYFSALVELFKGQDFTCPLHVLLALILFKCINAEQAARKTAIQLLQLLWLQMQSSDPKFSATKWSPGDSEACMDSHLPHTYCNAQNVLSGRLAQLQPKLCYDLFIHTVMRLDGMSPKDQATMLRALLPWIKQMDFRQYVDQHDFVLLNLTVVSLKYDVAHPSNIRDLWATFAAEESNVAAIVDFLLKIGDKKRNMEFMAIAKQILLLVARTQPQATVAALVNELSSLKKRVTSRLVSAEQAQNIISASTDVERQYAYASFNTLLPDTVNYAPPGRGHLSLVLLSELAFEQAVHFKPHLAVVLHQVFLGLDFALQSFVIEHCRILLLNLVNALGVKPSELESSGNDESAADLVEFLRTKENKQLWAHEDVTLRKPTIASAAELKKLVQRVVRCLGAGNKALTEEWAAEALGWAVSCPSAHLQNRSHQIYRALQPNVSREALDELLSSIARCIALHTPESNALLIEILSTLRCLVEPLDSNRLMLFTNLFWATVAVLHTDYEELYCQALLLLNQLTERLNWFDRSVQNIFVASTPKEWKPPFIGLQPMVIKGLLSTAAHPTAVELLGRFTLLPCHHVFQADNTRLMLNILCLLPDILTAPAERAAKWTEALAQAAEKDGRELLSKILHHFNPSPSWLQDLMREYAMQYFPQQTLVTFKCLFRFVTKGPHAYHQSTLQIIRALLRAADSSVFDQLKPRTTVWYGILLQHLNGPHWREVVNILDVSVSRVPATPMNLEPKDLLTFSTFTHNPEWLNVPSDGTQQASGNLAPVLEGAEMHKSEYAVAPEFFAKFFSSADVNALDAAGRSPDTSLRNTTASDESDSLPGSLRGTNSTAAPAAAAPASGGREEIVLGGEKAPAAAGGFPVFTGFDDFLESLDNLPSNTGPASPKAPPPAPEPADVQEYGRSSSFSTLIFKHAQRGKPTKFGSKLPLQKEAAELATQWSESVNQTSFSNVSDMFKIFPEATWLLNALREDFVASLAGFQKEVQGDENAKLLNNPLLKLAKMETLFKLPIPETSKVILNIIATKYRARLQADSSFERTFKEQRSRLLQSLNGQYLAYIEQKITIEDLRGTVQGAEQSREWISAVVSLHQQLLSMFQVNISLQAMISDLLASEPGDTAEEEAQKKVVEEELRANAALGEKIKPAKKRSLKKEKKDKKKDKKKAAVTEGLSAPDDDDGEKVIIAD